MLYKVPHVDRSPEIQHLRYVKVFRDHSLNEATLASRAVACCHLHPAAHSHIGLAH